MFPAGGTEREIGVPALRSWVGKVTLLNHNTQPASWLADLTRPTQFSAPRLLKEPRRPPNPLHNIFTNSPQKKTSRQVRNNRKWKKRRGGEGERVTGPAVRHDCPAPASFISINIRCAARHAGEIPGVTADQRAVLPQHDGRYPRVHVSDTELLLMSVSRTEGKAPAEPLIPVVRQQPRPLIIATGPSEAINRFVK